MTRRITKAIKIGKDVAIDNKGIVHIGSRRGPAYTPLVCEKFYPLYNGPCTYSADALVITCLVCLSCTIKFREYNF